mgnify:CR=1 FL=1
MLAMATERSKMHRAVALGGAWTADLVEERLAEALRTLSLLPATGCFPQGHKSTMPEPVQRMRDWLPQPGEENFVLKWKAAMAHLAAQKNRTRVLPDTASITRMEEALAWQHFVVPRSHFQVLTAKLLHEPEGRTARRFRISRMTLWRWRESAVRQIVAELNGDVANVTPTR